MKYSFLLKIFLLYHHCKIFLKLSEEGLNKRSSKNIKVKNETIFLNSIKKILKNNKTKAEIAKEYFNINKSFDFLYEKN